MRSMILLTVCLMLSTSSVFSIQALPEPRKQSVVRIETTEGNLGTGFFISDSVIFNAGLFLVTNKHVVKSRITQEYFDSVFIRCNVLKDDKVIATHDRATLYLKYGGKNLYYEHPDKNIDLVIILFGPVLRDENNILNFNPVGWTEKYILSTKVLSVAKRIQMDSLKIGDGTDVQIIGFSFQNKDLPQFHISRFGHVALFSKEPITQDILIPIGDCVCKVPMTSEWLIIDITSRPGDSGSPVLTWPENSKIPWIIGIVQGGSSINEVCLSHPSYYIWDLLDPLRKIVEGLRSGDIPFKDK